MSEFLWQPSADIQVLKQRALFVANIRDFFVARGYFEVETPQLAQHGVTDVYLSNLQTNFRNKPYYLQTSPEYHMKRLLAAGSGPIFQLARVFRDDELGRWHNPEFTLLEWYQLDWDHHDLMNEMDALLQTLLGCGPMLRKTYQAVFFEHCGLDLNSAGLSELKACVQRFGLDGVLPDLETDFDQYLFLLMSHVVEPGLAHEVVPVAVYDFPASQAALAQINQGVASRFEVYFRGLELANGFHELTDVTLQRARFAKDNAVRANLGLAPAPADEYLLSAMIHGLPACSGVALGVDRLFAQATHQPSLSNILAFDFSRA